jgi:threonine/homoserine/homoserine lactone efflux protein
VISNYLSFAILAGILVLIPGLDFALVLRYAATKSKKSAMLVSAGITTGLYVWGIAAVIGVAAILNSSAAAFNALRIIGALYLFFMGSKFVISSFGKRANAELPDISTKEKPYFRGLLSNILNPKPAIFYLSIFPLFIPTDSNHLLVGLTLVSIHAIETVVFFSLLIYFIGVLKPFFSRPTVARFIERVSGILIIGFGAKLLLDKSH